MTRFIHHKEREGKMEKPLIILRALRGYFLKGKHDCI
jgi:hypothetical protein